MLLSYRTQFPRDFALLRLGCDNIVRAAPYGVGKRLNIIIGYRYNISLRPVQLVFAPHLQIDSEPAWQNTYIIPG
jgi:hypothetical protein